MNFINRTSLNVSEKEVILAIWNTEYPENLQYKSLAAFDNYIENLDDTFHTLLQDNDKKIRGWYFDFIRDGERWFAILLDEKLQGKGFGKKLLQIGKQKNSQLNGWVIDHDTELKTNGERYKSPLDFYLKNGFVMMPSKRFERKHISAVRIQWKEAN